MNELRAAGLEESEPRANYQSQVTDYQEHRNHRADQERGVNGDVIHQVSQQQVGSEKRRRQEEVVSWGARRWSAEW